MYYALPQTSLLSSPAIFFAIFSLFCIFFNRLEFVEITKSTHTFMLFLTLLPGASYMRSPVNVTSLLMIAILVVSFTLFSEEGDPYTWPPYNPTISYNFKDENPDFKMPTKDLDDCAGVVGTKSLGWWTFKWGANKNSLVTDAAITPMLERLNQEFAYFRDTMGWPPDKRVQDGYRSAVYLYGSGLCTDNASNTELGGWQSSVKGYPIILASYYPVYSFDPSCTYRDREEQMSAMVHEGIHCILASLPGARKAAWFHEGGNTWLQQQATAQQTGNYSTMGFLNGAALIAPFMPIECYSGWLQDGSFGGPSAEGVDMYENGKQICTWRTFLGGTQYGNIFPTFLGEWLGLGSIPWIWKNCPDRILEGIAKALGEEQTRRLIMEYRAKLALLDMKKWSEACRRLLNDNFGRSLGAEWEPYWINCETWKATPYAKTTVDENGVLVPEQRTTPGWSGANQIPLVVTGNLVSVDFQPVTEENMSCQLCYRATDGTAIYSKPVKSGTCSLRLDKAPAGNVVIAVICNTDYIYKGEETRKAHYDYRLKPLTGVKKAADIYTRWYNTDLVSSFSPSSNSKQKSKFSISMENHNSLRVNYWLPQYSAVSITLFDPSGRLIGTPLRIYKKAGEHVTRLNLPEAGIANGLYILKLSSINGESIRTVNLVR